MYNILGILGISCITTHHTVSWMSSIPSQWIWTMVLEMSHDGYWQLHSSGSSTQPAVPQFKVTSHMWRSGFWILYALCSIGDGGGAGNERKHHRAGVHYSNVNCSQDIGYCGLPLISPLNIHTLPPLQPPSSYIGRFVLFKCPMGSAF